MAALGRLAGVVPHLDPPQVKIVGLAVAARRGRPPAARWTWLACRLLCVVLGVSFAGPAAAAAPVEQRKIEYLIAAVATLPGATFIRNGTAYDGPAAAAHLRLKLRNAGDRIVSADDFIRTCASASSMSGRPYLIRYADGRVVTAESFLRDRLAAYEPPDTSSRP